MSASNETFRAIAEPVARKLLGDPNQSLSSAGELRWGNNGSVSLNLDTGQWYDHENGTGGGVINLVMYKTRTDKTGALAWLVDNGFIDPKPNGKGRGRIVATYDYPDEAGNLLYQVVRFEPKDFRQRRPLPDGGWSWTVKDVRRVLYRLPEILNAADKTVFVCEGEKDADRLAGMGLVATCNAGGASKSKSGRSKWLASYSETLRGYRVVVLQDNDETGRAHAETVARSLSKAGAASVRVLALPGLGEKQDVSDWLDAGGTVDELLRLADETPEWRLEDNPDPEPGGSGAAWKFGLIMTKDMSEPRAILANAIHALRHAPEWDGVLWHNEFANVVVARKPPPWIADRTGWADAKWTDRDDGLVAEWMQRQGILIPREVAGQAVGIVAGDRKFHPVREYLDSLQWDGTPRIDRWLSIYLGADDDPYARAVGSRWLISAVARIYRPGAKADCALILEGPQGLLKSSALAVLGGEWFSDHISDFHSKDAAMETGRAWIMEIAELDAMSRSDVSAVKAFMSRSVDIFRPPYGKRVIEVPRQCVLAGSINRTAGEGYLKDPTGARRFWPVACTFVDLDALRRDRDQMWAEARERYRAGAKWWLETRDLEALATEQQAERYQGDAWETKINKWLEYEIDATVYDFIVEFPRRRNEPLHDVSVAEILEKALGIAPGRWSQADQNRVVRVLASMGFEQYRARRGDLRERRYRRIPPARQDGAAQAWPYGTDENQSGAEKEGAQPGKWRARI